MGNRDDESVEPKIQHEEEEDDEDDSNHAISPPANCGVKRKSTTPSSDPDEEDSDSEGSGEFDQEAIQRSLAEMIIIDELPFRFVKSEAYRQFVLSQCPRFQVPSVCTIARDCYQLYVDEKTRLKKFLQSSSDRISLTIETWTSLQTMDYLSLRAHFIDNEWTLKRKMLNFFPVSFHNGFDIGKAILRCLRDWGIDKVLTVTVDGASENDAAISFLKKRFDLSGSSILQGKYLHLKCIAQIINLVASDVLKEFNDLVDRVRGAVSYVTESSSNLQKFNQFAEIENIQSKGLFCLDVSTKWNSTYLMLNAAQKFERAFERLDEEDPLFKDELYFGDRVPNSDDWENVRRLVLFLQPFYELTLKVVGSVHVTSNIFLGEICEVHRLLQDWQLSSDAELSTMAKRMKEKYGKDWDSIGKMNMLVHVAAVLDPRNKLEFVEFCFKVMYAKEEAEMMTKEVKEAVFQLFNDYKRMMEISQPKQVNDGSQMSQKAEASGESNPLKKKRRGMSSDFKKYRAESGCVEQKPELIKYLSEELVDDNDDDDFNILDWWKSNSHRFPVLSRLARDVLAIPISTVPSRSAFNTGRSELNEYWGSFTPGRVQSLVCAQDWLLGPLDPDPSDYEKETEELYKKLESDILQMELESVSDSEKS